MNADPPLPPTLAVMLKGQATLLWGVLGEAHSLLAPSRDPTNLEAAEEVARQLRLRDLADGGTPEPRSSPDLLVRVINIAHECGTSDSNSSMPGMFK